MAQKFGTSGRRGLVMELTPYLAQLVIDAARAEELAVIDY